MNTVIDAWANSGQECCNAGCVNNGVLNVLSKTVPLKSYAELVGSAAKDFNHFCSLIQPISSPVISPTLPVVAPVIAPAPVAPVL
jgi:hypothetical protein